MKGIPHHHTAFFWDFPPQQTAPVPAVAAAQRFAKQQLSENDMNLVNFTAAHSEEQQGPETCQFH